MIYFFLVYAQTSNIMHKNKKKFDNGTGLGRNVFVRIICKVQQQTNIKVKFLLMHTHSKQRKKAQCSHTYIHTPQANTSLERRIAEADLALQLRYFIDQFLITQTKFRRIFVTLFGFQLPVGFQRDKS